MDESSQLQRDNIEEVDKKPEALLYEILNEVDGFFEQEQQHSEGGSRKRSRTSYTESTYTTDNLIQSLQDQLNRSNERVEIVEARLKGAEATNLELITEMKEREMNWLQEKRDLEAKIYAGKLGNKSQDLNLAKKLRDALRMVKEMRRAQREWSVKEAEITAMSGKSKEKLEDTLNLKNKLELEIKKIQSENAALIKEKMELRAEIKNPQTTFELENRSMVKIAQLERSERKLKRRVQALTDDLPEATMLREKNREIEAKLTKATKRIVQMEKEIVTNEHIQAQQKQWNNVFNDILKVRAETQLLISGSSYEINNLKAVKDVSPTTVLVMLRELQENEAIVLRSKRVAENRAIELGVQLSTCKQRLAARKKMQEETEENALKVEEKLRRSNTQCDFLRKQNNALKSIIKSYNDENDHQLANKDGIASGKDDVAEKEPATGGCSNDIHGISKSDHANPNDDDNNNDKKGNNLKLKEYQTALKNVNERLEFTLKEVASLPSPAVQSLLRRKTAKLEIELEEKEDELNKLKNTTSKLERKIIILEQRVGRGEYNANTTKVVHLTMNPAATEATAQEHNKLKRLEEEILRLKSIISKDKLKIDENADIDSRVSQNKLDKDNNVIINNLKKKNERLKEVFKDLRTKYKNAVYILTGWKIDMDMRSSSKPVILRSIFAENEADRLEFQISSSGAIQLMDTPFAKQIDEKVLFYLTTCKSFPAFLSQLTLQLFEKTTMTGTGTIGL
jgi:mitotic spindle assembly checkpoint protein MAD1